MLCNNLTREQSNKLYREVMLDKAYDTLRALCLEDLFFLLTIGFKRKDVNKDWLYERCREFEANPNGYLDLWAREHYKSTIITFGKSIQDILIDPETTVAIFSHTRPIAKGFLEQIKRELETNSFVQDLFPDVLFRDPRRESNKWSLDGGIVVKRKSNPKEATVEAHGLVDGQPTSKHFKILVYDDVVTRESVTTPDQIKKVTDAWELSLNLGSKGGVRRHIGTYYHFNDTYKAIAKRGAAIPRIHAATDNGKLEGKPLFLTREELDNKRRDMGPYTFSCHSGDTLITTECWGQQSIDSIRVGDKVVGWEIGGKDKSVNKSTLVSARVLAINVRKALAVKTTLDNGDVLTHTSDHKWWNGRAKEIEGGERVRKIYASIGLHDKQQGHVCQAVDMKVYKDKYTYLEAKAAGYLAGIIDADGSISGGSIHICQSRTVHPEVCRKIEDTLTLLNFKYSIFKKEKEGKTIHDYIILGGRQERIRLLAMNEGDFAKASKVEDLCYGTRGFGKGKKVKVVDQVEIGEIDVYNIQTETGNYLANGYCSKNCQMLLDPVADKAMGFKDEWLRHYDELKNYHDWNFYITVDPASEKKKDNDYTAMHVIGLAPDKNYYWVDGVRDRLNLSERTKQLFRLVRKWRPLKVGYEKYGLQADVEHIKYVMEIENYRFEILELGGGMAKEDRIRRLVPIFEQGRIWLPHFMRVVDSEGKMHDLVKDFIEEEYQAFPVAVHDDMLDCMSRIVDPLLMTKFPRERKFESQTATKGNMHNKVKTEYAVI